MSAAVHYHTHYNHCTDFKFCSSKTDSGEQQEHDKTHQQTNRKEVEMNMNKNEQERVETETEEQEAEADNMAGGHSGM